ncbi:MAG: sialate O-acetylesterase [Pirellulaceae bacterium]
MSAHLSKALQAVIAIVARLGTAVLRSEAKGTLPAMQLRTILLSAIFIAGAALDSQADDAKLRVYILAGQSNMVGQGDVKTIDYMKEDPVTLPIYQSLVGEDGDLYVSQRVRISSFYGKQNEVGKERLGRLKHGYANRQEAFGPELMFGITMEQHFDGPILIIKMAWGGNSLFNDFRPPSAGPLLPNRYTKYDYSKEKLATLAKAYSSKTGRRYRQLIEHVTMVLKDLKRVYPDYEPSRGYELAGMVWFQAHADYTNQDIYPLSDGESQYSGYTELLKHFVRDIRRDLDHPDLPFVIGEMGFWGNLTPGCFNPAGDRVLRTKRFRKAVQAVSKDEEFSGNVLTVPTAPFWDDELAKISLKLAPVDSMRLKLRRRTKGAPNENGNLSRQEQDDYLKRMQDGLLTESEQQLWGKAASSGGQIHYMGSAKFYAQAGQAFAKALLEISSR